MIDYKNNKKIHR